MLDHMEPHFGLPPPPAAASTPALGTFPPPPLPPQPPRPASPPSSASTSPPPSPSLAPTATPTAPAASTLPPLLPPPPHAYPAPPLSAAQLDALQSFLFNDVLRDYWSAEQRRAGARRAAAAAAVAAATASAGGAVAVLGAATTAVGGDGCGGASAEDCTREHDANGGGASPMELITSGAGAGGGTVDAVSPVVTRSGLSSSGAGTAATPPASTFPGVEDSPASSPAMPAPAGGALTTTGPSGAGDDAAWLAQPLDELRWAPAGGLLLPQPFCTFLPATANSFPTRVFPLLVLLGHELAADAALFVKVCRCLGAYLARAGPAALSGRSADDLRAVVAGTLLPAMALLPSHAPLAGELWERVLAHLPYAERSADVPPTLARAHSLNTET